MFLKGNSIAGINRVKLGSVRRLATVKLLKVEHADGFDRSWLAMTPEERKRTAKEFEQLEMQDWRTLTKEQARNSKCNIPLI